jgi:hypothetical protein
MPGDIPATIIARCHCLFWRSPDTPEFPRKGQIRLLRNRFRQKSRLIEATFPLSRPV